MQFLGITLGQKKKQMKRDRHELLNGFSKYISPYASGSTVSFSTEEKEVVKRITSFILDNVIDGKLTGQVTFTEKLSPLGQDMVAFLANNDVYWERGCFRVDWNWTDLTKTYTRR